MSRYARGEVVAVACVFRTDWPVFRRRAREAPDDAIEIHFHLAEWSPRKAKHNAPTEQEAVLDSLWRLSGGHRGQEFNNAERALCGAKLPLYANELPRGKMARVCNRCRVRVGLRPRKGRDHFARDLLGERP